MSKKLLVRYKNETIDITKFVDKHPGGEKTLLSASNSDIDFKFDVAVPHSAAAKYLLKDYRVSTHANEFVDRCTSNNNVYDHDEKAARQMDGHLIEADESMEHLVDWSRGMLSQIGSLKSNYIEWVNKPVDRPLRLFDSDFCELFSKSPFWVIPCYWIPITILLMKMSLDNNERCSISYILVHLAFGISLWTLIEYSIHRWIFHLDAIAQNPFICTLHFLFHGQHHKVPFDPYRLVFPVIPATMLGMVLGYLVYKSIYRSTNHPLLVLAGISVGYLAYDMIHYYLHFGNPSIGHLYYMKRYHYQHHFVGKDIGFGVSSSIWDRIFNTRIILRKLNYPLK